MVYVLLSLYDIRYVYDFKRLLNEILEIEDENRLGGINMTKKLRVAIIGCGGIAKGKHLPSLAKLSQIEMVAFCDIEAHS